MDPCIGRERNSSSGGGRYEIDEAGPPILTTETVGIQFYDGALFDPSSGEWREIPPAREDANYLWGDGGPSLASVWTPAGLFVWGTNPEQTERWGAIFDVESMSWEILEIGEDAPPLVRNHRVLSLGHDVYVFAGVTPGNDSAWRRLWKYSVVTRSWEEIDVPTWADPLLGAVVNGRLAFTGRCQGGDLYDPATDTWKPLSAEGEPPSSGIPRGAGSFLTITDTYYGEQETNQVWLLDLREELDE